MGLTTVVAVAIIYLFVLVCWALYLSVMQLRRVRDSLHPVAKANAHVLLFIGLLFDLVLNVVIGSILFWDVPREWTLTKRLKRCHIEFAGTWRVSIARWICAHLLNQFDSTGDHC